VPYFSKNGFGECVDFATYHDVAFGEFGEFGKLGE